MKYKVGDEVLVKNLDWYYKNRDRMDQVDCGKACFLRSMTTLCEKKVTISSVLPTLEVYRIKEDSGIYNWTDEMFEENLEEEIKLPDGYIFKDENGNVINVTKIVMEKKKKVYPKTYEECCKILGVDPNNFLTITNCYYGEVETTNYERGLLNNLTSLWYLRICRDAYWKLAGEKMGWGKPWEYDCHSEYLKPALICRNGFIQKVEIQYRNAILVFPTAEMRDAFYENFKELIERCKELL